MQGHVKWG